MPVAHRIRTAFQRPRQGGNEYVLTRWLFLRLLGVVYLAAFGSLWTQVLGLIGRGGIAPAADYLAFVTSVLGPDRFWRVPTLAWINAGDGMLLALCGVGSAASLLLILGVLQTPVLALLWLCYLSLVNIGQEFLSFQWDALLLETGLLAIFFAPLRLLARPSRETPPSRIVLLLLRLLLFRLMFFSGVVKLTSGDPTWRGLTALAYHYETQPLPTPLAWYAHSLPHWFHLASAVGVFVIELAVPFLIFAGRRARLAAGVLLALLQALIMLTGNFAFFNVLTLALCLLLFDDDALRRLLPPSVRGRVPRPVEVVAQRPGRLRAPLVLAVLLVYVLQIAGLSLALPRPARRVVQWLAPFHVVNSYGLFAVMTTERPEIIVEGSMDGQAWQAYEFRFKPGDPDRAPAWIAPYHPRLDWQMWFAALGGPQSNQWFRGFLLRLLEGAPEVLGLLQTNPFPDAPPRFVRAQLYDYRFTAGAVGGDSGAWWLREPRGVYVAPVSLGAP